MMQEQLLITFFFGEKEFYDLFVKFDENDIVKSTSIDFKRGG